MGLNSSWHLKFDKDKNHLLYDYIQANTKSSKIRFDGANLIIIDPCVECLFEKDGEILKYVNGLYDKFDPDYKRPYKQFEKDGKYGIGCIDFGINEGIDKSIIDFVCVTTNMSILFHRSDSVKNWFLELACLLEADICYLDKENVGYKIVYAKGQEIDIEIKEFSQKLYYEDDLERVKVGIMDSVKFALYDNFKL